MQWYTTNMQLCKGIHTLCQSDCSHAIFFLMRLCLTLGLEDRRSYKIRLRQGQPTHQELCKEVWSQCQSKSYLLDTGRKVAVCGGACVCSHWSVCKHLYGMFYRSNNMLSNSSLLIIFYLYLSVSPADCQSQGKSLILQHMMGYKQEKNDRLITHWIQQMSVGSTYHPA